MCKPLSGMSRDWFDLLFGFAERTGTAEGYLATQANFRVNGTKLRSVANNEEYEAGIFSTPTLAELRQEGRHCLEEERKAGGHKGGTSLRHVDTDDVFKDHSNPDNRNAVFQVASQFNCLEFVGPSVVPEDGVTGYSGDGTQGPACAIAAGAATVFRNYFATVGGQTGQTEELQVDNLQSLGELLANGQHKYWRVRNGYTESTRERLHALAARMETCERSQMRDLIRIGCQYDAQVTFKSRGWRNGFVRLEDPTVRVSQAFCSGISVSYSGLGQASWEPFAELVLEAAYEATLWMGVINHHRTGCPLVMLTMIGGGVFGNNELWIANAIARAVVILKREGANLDVRLLHLRNVSGLYVKAIYQAMGKYEEDNPAGPLVPIEGQNEPANEPDDKMNDKEDNPVEASSCAENVEGSSDEKECS